MTSRDELLCGARHHRHGDATDVDGNSLGATHQYGLARRIAVESDRNGLRTAGDGPVGSPARAVGGPVDKLSRSPCVAFCDPCPQRNRTEKLSKKSTRFPEPGLTTTEGCVNW